MRHYPQPDSLRKWFAEASSEYLARLHHALKKGGDSMSLVERIVYEQRPMNPRGTNGHRYVVIYPQDGR